MAQWSCDYNYDELFNKANLRELCEPNETQQGFLIRFALNHQGFSTMIIGTKNPEHVTANVEAATKGKLPDDVYAEAKRRLDAIGVISEGV